MKKVVFTASYVVWGGGLASTFLLSLYDLVPWQVWIIVVIAFITTCIYIYFGFSKTTPSTPVKDWLQILIPNVSAIVLVTIIITNPFIGFRMEELLRKHWYVSDLEYSGIESSMDENIKDSVAKKTFEEKRIAIAKGKDIDADFLIGCWFTLMPPKKSSQDCFTKAIEIKIKQNKYGRIWDLCHPVYLLTGGFNSEPEDIYDDFDGILKWGYKLNITCISPGEVLKVLLLLEKKEGSILSHQTWKYAISVRFRDN